MRRVGEKEFNNFDEVIAWAWNEYKLVLLEDVASEDEEFACAELHTFILHMEKTNED